MKKSKKRKTSASVFDQRLDVLERLLKELGQAGQLPRRRSFAKLKDAPFLFESARFAHYHEFLQGLVKDNPSFVRAVVKKPLLSERQARSLVKGAVGPGTVSQRHFLVLRFETDFISVTERQQAMTDVWDVDQGRTCATLFDILLDGKSLAASWEQLRMPRGMDERLDELLSRSQDRAVLAAEQGLDGLRKEMEDSKRRRRELLAEYYQIVEQECEEEKKSIYFHLYYFEQEEKLERRLAEAQKRLERLEEEEERMFSAQARIDLTSAALFAIPVFRYARQGTTDVVDIDGLTGRVLHGS